MKKIHIVVLCAIFLSLLISCGNHGVPEEALEVVKTEMSDFEDRGYSIDVTPSGKDCIVVRVELPDFSYTMTSAMLGDPYELEYWNDSIGDCIEFTEELKSLLESAGYDDIYAQMEIYSEKDHDTLFLQVKNGLLMYDIVNGIDIRN